MTSWKNTWGGCGSITEVSAGIKTMRDQSTTLMSGCKVTSKYSETPYLPFI